MEEVAGEGRTVIFVSHNMAAIESLCERAHLLDGGRLVASGPAADVVRDYLSSVTTEVSVPLDDREDRRGDGSIRLTSLRVTSADEDLLIRTGTRLKLTIGYRTRGDARFPRFRISIFDVTTAGIYLLDSDSDFAVSDRLPARGEITCLTGPINVTPGRCYIHLIAHRAGTLADYVRHAGSFDVEPSPFPGTTSKIPDRDEALFVVEQQWSVTGAGDSP
jgi:lipopolysaccharide transport system ATP-binding protein